MRSSVSSSGAIGGIAELTKTKKAWLPECSTSERKREVRTHPCIKLASCTCACVEETHRMTNMAIWLDNITRKAECTVKGYNNNIFARAEFRLDKLT